MKHDIATLQTKKSLAAALKELAQEKPFSKITVSQLIARCGFNRNTFYYHFEDIYALLKWTLEQEAIAVVKEFDLMVDYEEAIYFVMDYVEQNDKFLNNLCNSVGRDELKSFFYADFIGISRSIIDKAESIEQLCVSEDFKTFLGQFYTEAIAGILMNWIVDRSVRHRDQTVQYISTIMRTSIPAALHEAAKERERNDQALSCPSR